MAASRCAHPCRPPQAALPPRRQAALEQLVLQYFGATVLTSELLEKAGKCFKVV